MITKMKAYFPKSKLQWKEFALLALPVIGGSILFAMNSFVDNFMVGTIKGAGAGLFAVNSWTSIIMGIFAGTAATGSILVAQYYYSGNYDKVREIARIRYGITMFVVLNFAIASWVIPDVMVKAFMQAPEKASDLSLYNEGIKQGKKYIQYIAGMWILIAITFNIGNMTREIGWGKIALVAGIFGLVSNVTLNYLTMHTSAFGFKMEAEGAAIATIVARAAVLIIATVWVLYRKLPVVFWPWTIFNISKTIHYHFWKRALVFLFTASTMIFITIRNKLYVMGYPSGSIVASNNPSISIGSADMLNISWSIFGVISVVFNAINIVVSKFVGGELGKGNIEKAKDNSKRVHGFMLVSTIPFVLIGIIIVLLMPYMHFLRSTGHPERDALVLQEAALSMIPLLIYLPWWIWFVVSKSSTLSGGKVNLTTTIDVVTSGPMFLGWLAIVMLVIAPSAHLPFWVAYVIAFLADIPRGIAFMWVYYKREWAFNITKEEAANAISAANDNQENETLNKE